MKVLVCVSSEGKVTAASVLPLSHDFVHSINRCVANGGYVSTVDHPVSIYGDAAKNGLASPRAWTVLAMVLDVTLALAVQNLRSGSPTLLRDIVLPQLQSALDAWDQTIGGDDGPTQFRPSLESLIRELAENK